MVDRTSFAIGQQVLLADIGDIAGIAIFSEQVIEWLLAVRAHLFRDRFVPFLTIGEDRIDVENHAAKIENFVTNDIANPKPRLRALGCLNMLASLR